MSELEKSIKNAVRDVPNFPKEGIVFKDITPLLSDVSLSKEITNALADYWENYEIDTIVGIESRGFMWGHSLAQQMGVPFVPIRKKGKLPAESYSFEYELEYGSAEIEMHKDAIQNNHRVLIHDDLLATGGTAAGAAELVKMAGGVITGFSFIVELSFLGGEKLLSSHEEHIHALASY